MTKASNWGKYAGQYTYDLAWRGVQVTVECEVPTNDPDAISAVRILAGGVDITNLIEDIDAGDLCDALKDAHWPDRRAA